MLGTIRDELGDLLVLLRNLVILTALAAVYKELRTPPAQRTWNGSLFGVIPYDFRIPTLDRIRQAYWDTESEQVFGSRPLGVGWSINLPPLLRALGLMSERRPQPRAAAGRGGARAAPAAETGG